MLREYQNKRDFGSTPEPTAKTAAAGARDNRLVFVVQKHDASRLHYDFRIECDGVLKSWAVPKGPSLYPGRGRLAIQVEDHPIEYANFEGSIPKNAYGGGEVIVWDTGHYEPLVHDTPVEARLKQSVTRAGLKKGKLSFTLYGAKLKGAWTLVRIDGSDTEWLLIKKADEQSDAKREILELDQSVLTARTLDDVRTCRRGPPRSVLSLDNDFTGIQTPLTAVNTHSSRASVASKLSGATKQTIKRFAVSAMLASLADSAFDDPEWVFEPKLDGMRIIARRVIEGSENNTRTSLISRNGLDATRIYPGLVKALESTQNHEMVLDGEVVAAGENGEPSFQLLQQRINLTRNADIDRAENSIPVVFYVFDILYIDGYNLTAVPFEHRRRLLQEELIESPELQLTACTEKEGKLAYEAAIQHGFEGIIAKRLDSLYESGKRSRAWLKVKSTLSDDFVIGGYTLGQGRRAGTFGSLLLGQYPAAARANSRLIFCGHVGTGFNNDLTLNLYARLNSLRRDRCPFYEIPKTNAKAVWIKPQLSAEVKFASRTDDLQLRAPVFMHLRADKPAKDDIVQTKVHTKTASNAPLHEFGRDISDAIEQLISADEEATIELSAGEVHLTNLDKALWPTFHRNAPITKRDLVVYMLRMAHVLLAHVKDRPITLARYPDGVAGKHFIQRHWTHSTPEYMETVEAFSEDNNHDVEFLLCNNDASLLWLTQLANLEIHAWFSRTSRDADGDNLTQRFTHSAANIDASALNYPDFIAFDLDPYIYSGKEKDGEEPEFNPKAFKTTKEIAQLLKARLEDIGLKPYIKTSGKTGLHIYVPIFRSFPFDVTRGVCKTICRFIQEERPADVTMEWGAAKRFGKVFLDHNMNARSKTIASVYSPRAVPGACISTPIAWSELDSIHPAEFTIRTVPDRVGKLGDLWSDILTNKHDLSALARETH